MIKILNVISDTNIGGAGRVLLNYLRYFDRTKFDVSVALPCGSALKEAILALDVQIYEVDAMADKSLDISAISKLCRLIKQVEPDVVHTHGAFSGRIAAKLCGKKAVYTRHSAFELSKKWTSGVGKLIYKTVNETFADRMIAVSPVCRDDLISGGISPDRIDVVINGVERLEERSQTQLDALRKKYGVTQKDFTAGLVARVEPYKGHMYALEAVKMLKDDGCDIKLLIAGTGSFEDEVRARAKELEVTDSVIFCGFVEDVPGLMRILDVQVNASYVEATSMSLLEGMSIGLPAVASDHGGNPWIIHDGENGLLFPSRDSKALAEALRKAYDLPELLDKLSQGALKAYEEGFTGERFARNTEEVYVRTLGGKK